MSFVAAAIGAGAVAGIGGAIISSGAAGDAANTQAQASRYAADLQYKEYQQQRDDQAPWREAGAGALSQMKDPYFQQNFGAMDMQNDPGYQFRLEQGQKALEASAAARGGLMSGNTLQGISQYGQDYASNEYQNAYNRFTNNQSQRFNRLASLAGVGQTANGQVGQAGSNMANNVGNIMTGAGNASAASQMAQGNIWGGTLSSLGSQGANTWMQYQMMNRFAPQSSGGAVSGYSMPSLGSSSGYGAQPSGYSLGANLGAGGVD